MRSKTLILTNLIIADMVKSEIITGKEIAITGGEIAEVGKQLKKKYPGATIKDLNNMMVTPGLVCSHHHFYSALARGLLARIKPSKNFVEILNHLWWRLDRAIDEDILKFSALTGAIESIRCGVTSVIDHHASPGFIDGSLDVIADAFHETGLRGILAYEVTDRNGLGGAHKGLSENIRFAIKNKNDTLLRGSIGAHAPFTLSDDTMAGLEQAVSKTGCGIHIHVSEDRYEKEFSKEKYHVSPLKRLESMLNDKAIIAHGVHLNPAEISLLNAKDAFLVHNARSNMNNGVGYFHDLKMINKVALGTDGIGSDMLTEMQSAYFKNNEEGAGLTVDDYRSYLGNGNRIIERYFGYKFGQVEPGYKADLAIWDYQSPTPLVGKNMAGHLIFGLHHGFLRSVLIEGEFVYEERKFPCDVTEIYNSARIQAQRLWQRMDELPAFAKAAAR